MLAHSMPFQRLNQLRDLALSLAARQPCDLFGRGLSTQQCQYHVLSRYAEDIAKHAGNLDVCLLQQLLYPVTLATWHLASVARVGE